ncbi:hypothetical protein CSA37_05395 [Candidatus Fermentibacteria bacterium]|nr:MAG: hypothetical protein CSA37_05395 [Candidatus Fermentibacteria bacterium]
MTWLEAVVLAVVQGLTEFLPVSSSGHLALASQVMAVPESSIAFEVVLHLGTLMAVIAFYRNDLLEMITGIFRGRRSSIVLALLLCAATVPVAAAGLLAGDFIEGLFHNTLFVSGALAFTGFILFFLSGSSPDASREVSPKQGMLVGLFQALALFPGVSRSGTTICTGLRVGLSREEAARFSFLLSIPAIIGAAVKELPDASWSVSGNVLAAGFLVSAAVGFLALSVLVRFVKRGKLKGFALYCWSVAAAGFLFSITGAQGL